MCGGFVTDGFYAENTLVCARSASEHPVVVAAPPKLGNELRRDFPQLEQAGLDVLRRSPAAAVYVFFFAASEAVALAGEIVTWAKKGRPGLIGVIEDGGGKEREALLDAGFDDAVTGRIGAREIAVRIRAVQRRTQWGGRDRRLRFGGLALDLEDHVLWTGGIAITLTPVELAVLRELIKARGRPLSRIDLLEAAWGVDELEVTERAVDNVILRIRRKLPRPEMLETVRGVGFRIDVQARR